MDPSASGDRPDGTSIKPVSSLRAQFENLNKTNDTSPAPPPPRNPSPSLKSDRSRDARTANGPPPVPNTRPKERPTPATLQLSGPAESAPSPTRPILPAPMLSLRPLKPPSVMIQPPQSPPKGRVMNTFHRDHQAYLNPDSAAPATPSASPRAFKIPSRPHTPILEPRRSPRLSASQPPSPPPPRRSTELKREREPKLLPPPINRTEKPLIPSRNSFLSDASHVAEARRAITSESSPFSSPPSSSGSVDDEPPPSLPLRPRPQTEITNRPNSVQFGFEPPPVHHSVASRRKEKEQEPNGFVRGQITPQLSGEQRPALPMRPQTVTEPPPRPSVPSSATKPPQKPPRPGIVTSGLDVGSDFTPPKRVVSNPTTPLPPPIRTHGRSMTLDRTSDQTPTEFKQAPVPVTSAGVASQITTFPDTSNTNRRPPYIKQGTHDIQTKYDPRIFDVCGEYICTSGHLTRVWNVNDGEMLASFSHGEGVKATAIIFKPGATIQEEGTRLWIGNNYGELIEVDIATCDIVANRPNAHSRFEIIRAYRHFNELWTLDDGGTLHVWGPDNDGVPSLANSPHQTYRVPKAHSFSMVVGDELWHATGKEIRVFLPTSDGQAQFQVLVRPLIQENAGEVTSGTLMRSQPDKVFFGHIDGKVSIYARDSFSCLGVLSISTYKISSLTGAGRYVWAAYNTGKVCVYDIEQTPWVVKKEWQAHESAVVKIAADPASCYRLDRLQVITLGGDSIVRVWDGLLQDDWLESEIKLHDSQYCEFEELKALLMTWNAGATTPHSLRYSDSDASFIQDLLQNSDSPDILVFGFQELVDLEDKAATAKRFLKPKKKEGSDQERMSHQYRDWRDFLLKSLDDYMPSDELYHLLHTAHLVGLFTCIFVKSTIRDRIHNLSSGDVKRGMGGLHGNKGAIAVRFMVDDTSLCFINCHLAAGQSQANHRHNDVAAILEAPILPVERDPSVRLDSYVGGGDGTMILDHELCILNGDLNYRIDTMSRDTVVMAVKSKNLTKLLDRDQLLVAKRRNPNFRLRAFDEMPIAFPPTYKYDVGTDNYDTSEKKRSPAWCDRILYRGRGRGRIQQIDYQRHEVRVSDHRPVSGRFRFTVKSINQKKRAVAWMDCQQRFEDAKESERNEEKLSYLTDVCGYDPRTSRNLIRDEAARRDHRSRSRHRE